MKIVYTVEGAEILVDDEDYELVNSRTWKLDPKGYLYRGAKKLHQLIFTADLGQEVDHVDCNKLNNQKSNLRSVTKTQNQRNKRKSLVNKTGFKGVSFDKYHGKFSAKIQIGNGVQKHLGYHVTAELAYAAYCRGVEIYHGEHGRVA